MLRFEASFCRGVAVSVLAFFGSWANSSQAAGYVVYPDQTSWTTAAEKIQKTLFRSSIVTTSDLTGYGQPEIYFYSDRKDLVPLDNPSSAPLGLAFAGNFDLRPGGNGGGLSFLINFADGTAAVVMGAVNYPGGFLGITSDTTINSVEPFSSDLTGNGETFNYDLLTLKWQPNICVSCRPIL